MLSPFHSAKPCRLGQAAALNYPPSVKLFGCAFALWQIRNLPSLYSALRLKSARIGSGFLATCNERNGTYKRDWLTVPACWRACGCAWSWTESGQCDKTTSKWGQDNAAVPNTKKHSFKSQLTFWFLQHSLRSRNQPLNLKEVFVWLVINQTCLVSVRFRQGIESWRKSAKVKCFWLPN